MKRVQYKTLYIEAMCRLLLFISGISLAVSAWAQTPYVFPEDIKPLIQTRWGQNYPFNLLCPQTDGVHTEYTYKPAGCGPVSMAQMVYYHRYPSVSPDGKYEYDWEQMFHLLNAELQKESLVAVAKLISDCGISTFTEYGDKASGTSLLQMMAAMKHLFNYSNYMSVYDRSQFSTPERDSLFRQLLFSELKAGRPVLYRGYSKTEKGGHLFIIDGCKKKKVHVNMGWAGHRDGYYDLDDLGGYSQQQWMLVEVADSSYRLALKEVELREPGTLASQLTPKEQLTTRHIKLTGKMDGRDFAVLRNMLNTGLLRTIDMEQVSMKEMPDSAFMECTYLSHFVAPRTLQHTGKFTFSRCRNLNRVVFHEGLVMVGHAAFSGCSNLLGVQLPTTIKFIGHNAYTSCEALLSVVLPEGVERIGNYAFSYCDLLYSIYLPKSLQNAGTGIFKNCNRLAHVRLNPENPYLLVDESKELIQKPNK